MMLEMTYYGSRKRIRENVAVYRRFTDSSLLCIALKTALCYKALFENRTQASPR
jgi:hypothetical protein